MAMKFDPTITLGNLISLGGAGIAVVGSIYVTDYRLNALEKNVDKLSTVVIEAARSDERIKDMGRRLDNLERR